MIDDLLYWLIIGCCIGCCNLYGCVFCIVGIVASGPYAFFDACCVA